MAAFYTQTRTCSVETSKDGIAGKGIVGAL